MRICNNNRFICLSKKLHYPFALKSVLLSNVPCMLSNKKWKIADRSYFVHRVSKTVLLAVPFLSQKLMILGQYGSHWSGTKCTITDQLTMDVTPDIMLRSRRRGQKSEVRLAG